MSEDRSPRETISRPFTVAERREVRRLRRDMVLCTIGFMFLCGLGAFGVLLLGTWLVDLVVRIEPGTRDRISVIGGIATAVAVGWAFALDFGANLRESWRGRAEITTHAVRGWLRVGNEKSRTVLVALGDGPVLVLTAPRKKQAPAWRPRLRVHVSRLPGTGQFLHAEFEGDPAPLVGVIEEEPNLVFFHGARLPLDVEQLRKLAAPPG